MRLTEIAPSDASPTCRHPAIRHLTIGRLFGVDLLRRIDDTVLRVGVIIIGSPLTIALFMES